MEPLPDAEELLDPAADLSIPGIPKLEVLDRSPASALNDAGPLACRLRTAPASMRAAGDFLPASWKPDSNKCENFRLAKRAAERGKGMKKAAFTDA
jgi:hypothetical protein